MIVCSGLLIVFASLLFLVRQIAQINKHLIVHNERNLDVNEALNDLRISIMNQQHESFAALEHRQNQMANQLINQLQQNEHNASEARLHLVETLNRQHSEHRNELVKAVDKQSQQMNEQLQRLANITEQRLDKMSQRMNEKLSEGFENTVKTFSDILQRLALIDEAQKKISELSGNVVSLQNVLTDKRSRGAFGEVQLNALIDNVLAPDQYALQKTLKNGRIADCILYLPKPTGHIAIDAKFPLESFRKMTQNENNEQYKRVYQRQFKIDIKKHINDIAQRYIQPPETADSAIMFLPAEAIFAEIHAYHSDLVEYAWQQKVWITSPSTLMAVLTTARAVLKDEATRGQMHLIQKHLLALGEDFVRFQGRFDQLAKHINQAATDVQKIHTSAGKISERFKSIERVEISEQIDKISPSQK